MCDIVAMMPVGRSSVDLCTSNVSLAQLHVLLNLEALPVPVVACAWCLPVPCESER